MAPDVISALWRSGTTMLRAFWKFTRQLFHEATGTLFGLFALYGAAAAWRQSHQPSGQWITVFAAGYAVMMAAFSFSAFRSARRVR
jgi:glycerol uptake facilitator-like aquaporin